MAFGCGPSGQETALESQEQSMASALQQDYTSRFASQSAALQNLNTALSPIVAAGPNQAGFSAPELAARNTSAINTTAGNFRNAQQEAATSLAGEGGGGTSGLASGIDKQIQGTIASEGAGQLSNEENQIQQENFATGRSNFFNAEAGENALAGEYNPMGYASAATNANAGAFGESNTIQQQTGQEWGDIGGAILGGAQGVAGGLSGAGVGGNTTKGLSAGLAFL